MIPSKSQKLQKAQNHTLTKHGVIWKISKDTKIRDQGMENVFFALCFWICIRGMGCDFKVGFFVFLENGTFF